MNVIRVEPKICLKSYLLSPQDRSLDLGRVVYGIITLQRPVIWIHYNRSLEWDPIN
jgi:hypothetical protein